LKRYEWQAPCLLRIWLEPGSVCTRTEVRPTRRMQCGSDRCCCHQKVVGGGVVSLSMDLRPVRVSTPTPCAAAPPPHPSVARCQVRLSVQLRHGRYGVEVTQDLDWWKWKGTWEVEVDCGTVFCGVRPSIIHRRDGNRMMRGRASDAYGVRKFGLSIESGESVLPPSFQSVKIT
jgi:hypothetical protein